MSEPKCPWVAKMLPAYLDGELARPEAQAIGRHLEHCPSCQARARLLDETWETLDEAQVAPRPRVAPDFTERMMARVAAEKQRQAAEARRRPSRILWQVGASGVGLAAGLILGLAIHARTMAAAPEAVNPVEQEISRNVKFIQDAPLVEEMTLIQAMDRLVAERPGGGGVQR
jgi:anti-sigma factor RsiW